MLYYVPSKGENMTREEIEEQVKEIINRQLGTNKKLITPEKSFQDDMGADQLDVVELVMTVEEHFNIAISCEDAETITTVGALLDYLQAKGV